ncbi:hypothetical protein J3R30DRAFT_108755 [Lentinula aciculospora]|uniref:DUF6534 domain-containing protein n=1 Tax=Lentinula aciculospora TaxID=153920 RepID=A0A9W9AU48_9AGAR|nr:hypothetical protein J3R30DRAFT_108755 [Lentinula aciculospora]
MASITCSTSPVAPLHSTMGALLIGVLVSGSLWGVSAVQVYLYFSTFYTQDTFRLKLLVVFIFALDTAHQVMLSHLIYIYLVSNFGNVEFLGVVTWSMIVMVLLSALIAVTIQLFMCWRIWILSNKNVYWITPIIIIVVASFVITIVYFEKSWSLRTWTKLANLSNISRAVNGLNFGGDIAITFAMVYLLRISRSGIKRTDALMNRLMYFCLRTGLLTTLSAILSLISISVWPGTFIYITFYCALARLYANSLLATLNARDQLRKSNRPAGSSLFSNLTFSGMDTSSDTNLDSDTNPISIKQDVETHVHCDIEMNSFAVNTLASTSPV